MPESVDQWWARRQWSKGVGVPYPVGAYRNEWACGHPRDPRCIEASGDRDLRCALCRHLDSRVMTRAVLLDMVTPGRRPALTDESRVYARYPWMCPVGHGSYEAKIEQVVEGRRCAVCWHARASADRVGIGDAFRSGWAPKPASRAEADLRQRLGARLEVDLGMNAVKVARPFFSHIEVWPDILIPELRVAIEYDTVGRDGLEHVGRREIVDRRKDRLLRAAGWEVIRIRVGKLLPLGPYDIVAPAVSSPLIVKILDRLGEIRGELFVAAYLK